MEKYIVSARKYRPRNFDSVVGQNALTTTLKNAIASGKLAHAYLFCGPRGVGKTTCARIFAKAINCLNPGQNGEPCDECESCRAFNENRSYNIHELDAASNNSVDDMRSLIEQAQIPPQVGKYKTFIIDEVHMLSTGAFNAFLKTLEEPPAHDIFILATTEKHKLLPTILSRCQIYDFKRMEIPDIVNHLKYVAKDMGVSYEDEALNVIAQKADGGMRDALSIFDQVASFSEGNITYHKVIEDLNVLDYEYYFRLTDCLLKCDIPESLLILNEVLSKGFDAQHFIGGLATHLRDLLVSKEPRTTKLLDVADSVRQRYAEQAQRCKPAILYKALRLCNDCDINYRTASNKRLLVELTLIQVAQLSSDEEPSAGRSPAKNIKPIFSSAPANNPAQERKPAATTAATTTTPATTPAAAAKPAVLSTPIKAPAAATTTAPQPKGPRILSISGLANEKNQKSAAQEKPLDELTANLGEKPFTDSDLRVHWQRYASQLPIEKRAMSERMKNMQPALKEGAQVEVVVDNRQVLEYMEEMRYDITLHLRRELDNRHINLNMRIREITERRPAYSQKEIFEQLLETHPEFRQLKEDLKLELN